MSLLTILPLRWFHRRPRFFALPAWLHSLRGAFSLFLVLFCLLQCASALLLTRLVDKTQQNVTLSHQLAERQSLLDKARMELLTASDNSQGGGIYLMQDIQTGSVDSWKSLAESAQASLNNAQKLFARYQAEANSPLAQNFAMLAEGLKEQLKGLNARDIDAFFMVPMQAFQQQFNDAYYQTLNQANANSAQANQSTLGSLTTSRNVSLGISALLLLLLLAGGWMLLRGVILPLSSVSRQLSRIATGDLTQQPSAGNWHASEIRQLNGSISGMQHGLQHMVGEINAISHAVMQSADRMAEQNQEYSAYNQQQTDTFAHLSQRLTRVAEEVEHSVEFASHATHQVQAADRLTQRCGVMVADVEAQMRDIVGASGEIAGIVTLLESLSLQTKLLALNAAIESAHAGVYGRSFSIVAREIGLLSEKSGASTRNIDTLITTTHQHIDHGFSKVQALDTLYAEIASAVTGVVTVLHELQQNASTQSKRVNTIAGEIARMHEQVRNSEALTQRGASASENLVSHAQRLSQSVSQFVL
ncbi:methyl-accepting chemotaxis protein [Erwinia pyri]|uniref:Methyl-accepting chemotaxis protein n=1 Tax=Erwinia pyri TaxID=3062598 RepID=A0AA50DK11_9GAMM|nr:methyl-accepting chemotaxis protein [Erwinia sp. DE2]WLS77430.1 methyl-accepting chemotaxis protein [Erwinia sp. DE2]